MTTKTIDLTKIRTLGELKTLGYQPKTVKEELRQNLIEKLKSGESIFQGILGYETTVIPDIQRAILSKHNIILLGLRGQAKTRIARQMTELLDEYIPVVHGSELNDDPFAPISKKAMDTLKTHGDDTRIDWIHRSERYAEKLATPDVSVADLIGDVDPIKAANLRLSYADEGVIHYGIVPRSNRCIFVINELPDLQPRIQVSLFNILQEGDVQIRGFKLRLNLDIQFVFTANPEDYTNRGSIVTPLKDRIESQILTHYPRNMEVSQQITVQEAKLSEEQKNRVKYVPLALLLNEQIAFEARESEYVDEKSGVSARLTITAFENLVSTAERRALINNEEQTYIRVGDFWGVVPAITGKIELVYEGEQEGPMIVAQNLVGKAIRTQFKELFPDPEKLKKHKEESFYQRIVDWFGSGNTIDLLEELSNDGYAKVLASIPGLDDIIEKYQPQARGAERLFLMEFVLHGLAEFSLLSKHHLDRGIQFKDLFSTVFSVNDTFGLDEEGEEYDEDYNN